MAVRTPGRSENKRIPFRFGGNSTHSGDPRHLRVDFRLSW